VALSDGTSSQNEDAPCIGVRAAFCRRLSFPALWGTSRCQAPGSRHWHRGRYVTDPAIVRGVYRKNVSVRAVQGQLRLIHDEVMPACEREPVAG
jgi:hypothetical protein